MIDAEWLGQLQLELGEGYRVDGIIVGGTNAVFRVIYPNGTKWAYRLPRELLLFPSYIKEVPNWLVPAPHYDVHRLNRKLANLLGDPELHIRIQKYDLLFYSIIESCYQAGDPDLDTFKTETEQDNDIWQFILQTPAVSYRLNEYATSSGDNERQAWAKHALEAVGRLGAGNPTFSPASIFDNPLFVWGGAISEGYFTKSELPEAVSAVKSHLGSLPAEDVQIFLRQMYGLLYMMYSMEGYPRPTAIGVFCDATGFYPGKFTTDEERSAPDEFGALLETIKNES